MKKPVGSILLALVLMAVAATVTSASDYYLPHLTGATTEWQDILEVDNNDDASGSFTITLYNAGAQVYTGTHNIGAHEYSNINLKALNNSATCGKITTSSPGLHFRLAFESAIGGGVAEFLLNDDTSTTPCFLFANYSAGTVWKGLAAMNPGTTAANMTLYAIGGGELLGQTSLTLGAKAHLQGVPGVTWLPGVTNIDVERVVVSSSQPLCGITISGDGTLSKLLFTQAVGLASFTPPGSGVTTVPKIPDTGITLCYDYDSVIPCPSPGQPFHGQDAQYNPPSTQLSYTDHGDGTVTDNVTGLMWEKSDDGVQRTWQGAIDHCQACTTGGHTDWRLPDIHELFNLVDCGRFSPAIDPLFDCRHSSLYWSSSLYAVGSDGAWGVSFSYGSTGSVSKSGTEYVRCVRAGQ